MIDFSTVKFDENNAPFVVERGAKGKFKRRYLNDAEQQAHKEWDIERVARRQVEAGGVAGTDRASARTATLRNGYYSMPDGSQSDTCVAGQSAPVGATGAVGPGHCPAGHCPEGAESVIPFSLESGHDLDVPVGQRVARRSVNLMDSLAHLTTALYEFGAIDNACVADVRTRILELTDSNENERDDEGCACPDDELIEPYYYVKSMAALLYRSYIESRTQAPMKVVGYHAAPVITLTQYLMGIIFPEGDMAGRAQSGHLLHRGDEDVGPLAMDILTVYNNIQADLSEAGNRLLGQAPEEIGGVNVSLGDLPKLDTVRAVDEMLEYLVTRIDSLTMMLTEQL